MNCKNVQSHIQHYIDQSIDFFHAEAIEEHINQCDACAGELRSYKKLISFLHEADDPQLDDRTWREIHQSVMKSVSSLPQKKSVINLPVFQLFDARYMPIQALAALLVIAVISLSILLLPARFQNKNLSISGNRNYPMVVAMNGNVFTRDAQSENLSQVTDNLALPPGMAVETDFNASAKIKVDEISIIEVGQRSRLSITECASKRSVFKLTQGDIAAHVGKRKPDELFRIETPNAFCEVIGTRFNITTQHDDFRNRYITALVVQEGTVRFGSGQSQLSVTAGHAVAIFGDSLGIPTESNDPIINQLQREPGRGIFTITSTPPEALVLIDGMPSGFTPLSGTAPFGTHSVICIKNGFLRSKGTIVVEAHAKAELNLTLKQGTQPPTDSTVVLAAGNTLDNSLLIKATEQMIAGNYPEALIHLDKLFNDKTPAIQAAALYKASTCHKYLGNYSTAAELLQQIIEGNFPDDIRGNALFERASIFRNLLHDASSAVTDFRRYTREFNNGLWIEEASYSLAEMLLQFQDYQQAAQEYQKYCDAFPKTGRTEKALYKLGIIYANNLSDPQKGLKTFTRLLLEFPNTQFSEDAVFWSADCLMRMGLGNRALNEFNAYIKRYPNGKWLTEAKTRLKRIETAEAR